MIKWEIGSGDITTTNLMSNTHLENALKQKQRQLKDPYHNQNKDCEKRFKRTIAILEYEINLRLQLGIFIPKTMYLPEEDDIDDEEPWFENFWSMDDN